MRIGKINRGVAFAALTIGVICAPSFCSPGRATADTVEDHSVFYRLLAKYQHGDEMIDFNIVVGCGVRVTRYGDGAESFDALRDPVVFARVTEEGHAVMQMVPDACLGQTTENGEVPDDFLPGVLWFEHANDFSLGIAYVTEDAFENAQSRLRFLGSSIHSATREEWLAFQPEAARNLFDPRPLSAFFRIPKAEEVKRNLGNSRELARIWPSLGCYFVQRIHISDPAARAAVRAYWPSEKPRFWSPDGKDLKTINKAIHLYSDLVSDGLPVKHYQRLNYAGGHGFATRAQGGVIGSEHRAWDRLPATIFPLQHDEGIPWLTPAYLTSEILYRRVDLAQGQNKGLAYCYSQIVGDWLGVPAYLNGQFRSLVDGEPIVGAANDTRTPPRSAPWPFFENDEYFYFADDFGLN